MALAAFTNSINNAHSFSPDKSVPDLSEKVILVTGGNAGVGLESVIQLVQHGKPARVYMGARSTEKYDIAMRHASQKWTERGVDLSALNDLFSRVHHLQLDLSDFTSVAAAAKHITTSSSRLDILMNNAGVMALPPGLTKQNYEIQFGTNHLGHALLTKLLLPLLLQTSKQSSPGAVRIINLTSLAEGMAPKSSTGGGVDFSLLKTPMANFHTYTRYGQSKLANVLFTSRLHHLYNPQGIKAIAIHPGRVQTQLLDTFFGSSACSSSAPKKSWSEKGMALFQSSYDRFFIMSTEKGAWNQVWAASCPVAQLDGRGEVAYYIPVGKAMGSPSGFARDQRLAERLWEWQEKEFEGYGF